MLAISAVLLASAGAGAATVTYGWEDGVGTILGSFGNLVDDTNVSGVQPRIEGGVAVADVPGPNSGLRYLHVAEDPHGSTPQGYLVFIENLVPGDVVDASFFGYDTTLGSSPSMRIWGHYALNGDINNYQGSASGNTTYTGDAVSGWEQVGHSWTVAAGKEALVVELRLYSTPSTSDPNHTDFFVDDLSVTAPNSASITVAPEPASLSLLALGGLAILRRRR
ncbi:MAG: PEP-CTERM sorting domain-containing protein [Planctomycetes bacterium]|nr:PEP-CTERM sorting domain-containing protein [Planctomycetota bacterium]